MHLKGDAFNQQLQNLINKYPQIQKNMKSEFIAYYDKDANKETVADYAWSLKKPTNEIMKTYPGEKRMRFYKDKVSPYELDQYGRLNPDADEIYVIGGNYNEKK